MQSTDRYPVSIASFRDITVACLITVPCGGKTTTARGLHSLMPTGASHLADTSDGLDWNLAQKTELADELHAARADRSAGGLIPDRLTIPATVAYLEQKVLPTANGTGILYLSGFPRTRDQIRLLRLFKAFVVIHLVVPVKIAEQRCLKRWRETPPEKRREDDPATEELLMMKFRGKRLPAYQRETLPAIESLGDHRFDIDGTLPLEVQTELILHNLAHLNIFDRAVYDHVTLNFSNPRHPFHTQIVAGTAHGKKPVRAAPSHDFLLTKGTLLQGEFA